VLPDAIAPSLACTPEFARRASWSHAIEVQRLLYIGSYKEFLSFVYRELFEVSITVNLVGIKVFSLQKFLLRYSSWLLIGISDKNTCWNRSQNN
jgi:hypothetical protein